MRKNKSKTLTNIQRVETSCIGSNFFLSCEAVLVLNRIQAREIMCEGAVAAAAAKSLQMFDPV